MKTKAFSKEGLIQSARLDPKQQEKLETTQWLQNCVEELQLQVETAEAEIETLQGAGRKKSKANSTAHERLEELERLNERRKWHSSRLELILRLMDNGTLSSDRVLALKEDVQYFVDENAVSRVFLSFVRPCYQTRCRMRTLMRMRGSTMTSILKKKRRNSAV
jgi:CCR4-NOT transcription complex subunit 3